MALKNIGHIPMKTYSVRQHLLSGSSFQNFIVLLFVNRFRVSLVYVPRLLYIILTTLLLFPLHLLEFILYYKKVNKTCLAHDPIFIIGHCRSGTTYLHNLLSQDEQFNYPTTYQCFLPGVFLMGKKFMKRIHQRTLPQTRPMDNVKMHPDYPQEEEFGMLSLGSPSYYQVLFFPNRMMDQFKSFALMGDIVVERWEKQYTHFLKKISYHNQRRLLLKNPVNTVRIKNLVKIFPKAKFIYIYRTKEDVIKSTIKLYQDLLRINTFQHIYDAKLKENINQIYTETIAQYHQQKKLIAQGHLVEVRYEDFIKHPFSTTQAIYFALDLGGHKNASKHFEDYITDQTNYVRNTYN